MDKLSSLILVAIAIALVIPTLIILKLFKYLNKVTNGLFPYKLQGWYDKLYYFLFWNGTIRYIIESYLAVSLVNLSAIFTDELSWSRPI